MAAGTVEIYYGEGKGKSSAALGKAIRLASEGKEVFVIQFLKGKTDNEMEYLSRLEPEIKFFRFEKSVEHFNELSEQEQKDEACNIKNGVNFARKVLSTGECDLLVLDEVLGLLDNGLVDSEELESIIISRSETTNVMLTGRVLDDRLRNIADEIYQISSEC